MGTRRSRRATRLPASAGKRATKASPRAPPRGWPLSARGRVAAAIRPAPTSSCAPPSARSGSARRQPLAATQAHRPAPGSVLICLIFALALCHALAIGPPTAALDPRSRGRCPPRRGAGRRTGNGRLVQAGRPIVAAPGTESPYAPPRRHRHARRLARVEIGPASSRRRPRSRPPACCRARSAAFIDRQWGNPGGAWKNVRGWPAGASHHCRYE